MIFHHFVKVVVACVVYRDLFLGFQRLALVALALAQL